ncbi:calcium-binding protein [Chachezhania sediminis]|uniref:calcium-binding protein n=1 Tax=Chachezhania sediminis TaxID=2599291 RepID=UPI00131D9C99|nr:calcium-binding protein [Chachezhania sediminis]
MDQTDVLKAGNGTTHQVHIYDTPLYKDHDLLVRLDFSEVTRFSQGHHVFTGAGNDIIDFQNFNSVDSVVVGRLNDFDPTRDQIALDGQAIDLTNPPSNVRIVEFNGNHNDPGAHPQQWMLVTTDAGGKIFYALEGFRIDMTGDGIARDGNEEGHFIREEGVPDFSKLTDVAYEDPQDTVPDGFTAADGNIINDIDSNPADVNDLISGTNGVDLIAGGLNDDTISGGNGDDKIWGGSGHDTVFGGNGDDVIWGGFGEDDLVGGDGDDVIFGGKHSDELHGLAGNDTLRGERDDDVLFGNEGDDYLVGGGGSDLLFGGDDDDILEGGFGFDQLNGGQGADILTGDAGRDTFVFKSDHMIHWDNLSGTGTEKLLQLDRITDFTIGDDVIAFDGIPYIQSMADLDTWVNTIDGNKYFTLRVSATDERILVDVDDSVGQAQFMDADNFLFT